MSIRTVTVLTLFALFVAATVSAMSEISTDKKILEDGIKTAETYWNSQKVSDMVLFQSVTPHESMNVVFEWSYVNKSGVLVEDTPVADIKSHLQNFMGHQKKYHSMPKYTNASISELKAASAYAESIEKGGSPMLGNLLKKGYWDTIIPNTLADMSRYRLMTFKYIADVKLQSKGGVVLQKRTTLHLYRMIADSNDSGWKVLFVKGLYNLPPI